MTGLREKLLVGGVLALAAVLFAWMNGAVRVPVNLGIVRFGSVSLSVVVFVAFLLGMVTLFLASLKAEMRTARMLKRYREALGRDAPSPATDRAAEPDPAADEI